MWEFGGGVADSRPLGYVPYVYTVFVTLFVVPI